MKKIFLLKKRWCLSLFISLLFFSGSVHAQTSNYFNGFETGIGPDDWADATRVPSGTHGVMSATGNWHAEVDMNGAFTRFGHVGGGAYNPVFPGCGYKTSLDMYLDVNEGANNDTRVDYSSAINDASGLFRRDFVFNIGFYNDLTGPGAGTNRFVISASNNASRSGAFPKNPARMPIAIPVTGWYTFEHSFRNNGGDLAVDLTIYNASHVPIATWTLSDPTDIIGTNVGGARYGLVDFNEFVFWPIDNSALTLNPPIIWYRDADGDGFGDPESTTTTCTNVAPVGYVSNNTDCNDNDPGVHSNPKLSTTINGVMVNSNNDGTDDQASFSVCNTPNNLVFGPFADQNGNAGPSVKAFQQILMTNNVTVPFCNNCSAPLTAFNGATGSAALVNPNAPGTLVMKFREWIDTDNDGVIDANECSATDAIIYTITVNPLNTYYTDADADGYGTGPAIMSCTQPPNTATQNGDCNDANPAVHPGAIEVCNGMDDDCDGLVDEGVTTTFYRDLDNDGHGKASSGTVQACSPPAGYVASNDDCNDNDATIYPGAPELCDGKDNDCDGQVDEGLPQFTYYRDFDGDGYGDPTNSITVCSPMPPAGYVSNNYDCDDHKKENNPQDVRVVMCHNGKSECVPAKDTTKKKNEGWTLGPCTQANCGATMTLMCNHGTTECVKNQDVNKKIQEGWTLGPCTSPCNSNETLMCHNGKEECVNNKDTTKKKNEGWTIGRCPEGAQARGAITSAWDNDDEIIPQQYRMTNYPNPFNTSTTIRYELPVDSKVLITLYDPMGRPVATLVEAFRKAGRYNFELNAGKLTGGVYYYKMTAVSDGRKFEQGQKLMIIK